MESTYNMCSIILPFEVEFQIGSDGDVLPYSVYDDKRSRQILLLRWSYRSMIDLQRLLQCECGKEMGGHPKEGYWFEWFVNFWLMKWSIWKKQNRSIRVNRVAIYQRGYIYWSIHDKDWWLSHECRNGTVLNKWTPRLTRTNPQSFRCRWVIGNLKMDVVGLLRRDDGSNQ